MKRFLIIIIVLYLQAFFDFVISLNKVRLDQDNDTLKEILKANVHKPIEMLVYSRWERIYILLCAML